MYTNNTGITLSLAVWLATDNYDHNPDPMAISATTLLKAIKPIVLARQLVAQGAEKEGDLVSLVASRMGTAIHDSIEAAWTPLDRKKLEETLIGLGFPKGVAKKVKVNPTADELESGCIPVYMEQRAFKKVGAYTISGKYDFVAEGRLEDFKSTGTYSYMKQTGKDKYVQQGSIYRWLNPKIITDDTMRIQYIFTDWSALGAMKDKNYPATRILSQTFHLMSISETDAFVKNRIHLIDTLKDASQKDLPDCTSEELWMNDPVWKYYKNPSKTSRATKNFDVEHEAYARLSKDGNVGVVIKKEAEPKACKYCPVSQVCEQAAGYVNLGILKL